MSIFSMHSSKAAPFVMPWVTTYDADTFAGLVLALPPVLSTKARGGLGLVPRRTSALGEIWRRRFTPHEISERIDVHHRPYHAQIGTLMGAAHGQHGSALLLDIHSMTEPCRPLMVCGTQDKNAAYARQLGTPADLLIDTGHPAGLRMVERGGFGDPASPRKALLTAVKEAVDNSLDACEEARKHAWLVAIPTGSLAAYLPDLSISRVGTFWYFLHFFLVWYITYFRIEKPLPVPESITQSVLAKGGR